MNVQGRKVLVVEDETVVALDVARRLRGMGFSVLGPVDTGEDALQLCRAGEPIDAVIMDVRLGGPMDGIETAGRIREVSTVPVIFLTAFSDAHTLDRIAATEPYGYLLKPFDERALWVTVHTALRRHEQEQERARVERLQQISDARYRAILDHSHDGIVSIDAQQRVVVFNRGAENIFGIAAADALGKPLSQFIPVGSADRHRQLVEAVVQGEVVSRPMTLREVEGRRMSGETFPVEVSLSRQNFDGEIMVTAIVRDLTERKRLQAQFEHSQKLETIGRLASSVAHDFNNQLVPIGGYAELLCRALPETDSRRADAEEIRTATQRAARLTRQLLLFSRRDVPRPVPLQVDEVLQELAGMVGRLLGSDITIELDLSAGPTRVSLDPSSLEQIVMNLVVNARDALAYGGRIIVATAVEQASEVPVLAEQRSTDPWLRLSVIDSGPGIPAALHDRVFEPFFTTKPAGMGTGLGLSTVLSIVQQARGVIDLVSEAGRGTAFHVYLPVHSGALGAAVQIPAPSSKAQVGSEEPFRILVVDDDDAVRRFTGRVLREAGYDVTLARTPAEALSRCPPSLQLLLCDMVLPGISGPELAAQIVAREGCAVLFTTGYADEDLQRRGLSMSGTDILRKPYGAHDLEGAVMAQEQGLSKRARAQR